MVDILGLPLSVSRTLKAKVLAFIVQGQWCLPSSFRAAFHEVALQIDNVERYNKGDTLI